MWGPCGLISVRTTSSVVPCDGGHLNLGVDWTHRHERPRLVYTVDYSFPYFRNRLDSVRREVRLVSFNEWKDLDLVGTCLRLDYSTKCKDPSSQ